MDRKIIRGIACALALACLLSLLLIPAAAGGTVVIALDPGHGKNDGGAVVTWNGTEYIEADLCWKIAGYCKDYLESHYSNVKVILTRTEEENPTLQERVDFAAAASADFLLSIHLNTYEDSSIHGATALVPGGTYNEGQAEISWAVADAILGELEAIGAKNRGQTYKTLKRDKYPNGKGQDSYYLIRDAVLANLPCIIMEECFATSPTDWDAFLSTDEKMQALAAANARALGTAFSLTEIPQPTETTAPSEAPQPSEADPAGSTPAGSTPAGGQTDDGEAEKPGFLQSALNILTKVLIISAGLLLLAIAALFALRAYNIRQYRKRQAARRRRKQNSRQ